MDLPAYGHIDHLQDLEDTPATVPADGEAPVWDDATSAFLWGATVGENLSALHSVGIVDDALFWTPGPHGNPQAVFDADTNRTWIVFLRAGADLYATFYDHLEGSVADPVKVADYPFSEVDFHHTPALMLADDGTLHVVWGGHNDPNAHRHYRTDSPRDLTSWTVQTLELGTYPFAVVTDTGELIFTDRPADSHGSTFPAHEFGAMWRSTDGENWTRTEIVDTTGTPESHSDFYQKGLVWADGRAHMTWIVARGASHDGDKRNVYYAAFDPDTGDWFAADGTNLGQVITWAEHPDCLVAEATADQIRGSLTWHLGRPAVAYAVQGSGEVNVAIWDGTAWVEDVVAAESSFDLTSTPDELVLLVRDGHEVDHWRHVDGVWEQSGLVLRERDLVGGEGRWALGPVYDGPALTLAVWFAGPWPGDDDTVVGPLTLATRWLPAAVDDESDHEHLHRLVVLVDDGAGGVEPLTDGGGLWLYGDFPGTEH